jgi:ABC-type branched-subunit amino acid transport system substrate-binding protein
MVALLGLSLMLVACGVGGSAAPTNGGDFTMGALVALSGVYGPYGAAYEAGMNVAVDRVNAAGGIVVDNKRYKLKMMYVDDRSDPQTAVADATQMIQDDNIKVLFGPLANEAISATPVIAAHNVVNVSLGADLFGLIGPKYPLLFSALPASGYRWGAATAGLLHFYPKTKRVDFLTGAQDGTLQPMTEALQAQGISAGNFTYPPGTTVISTVATKVVADKPDVVVIGNSPSEEQSDLQQLDAAGLPKSVVCLCYATQLPPSIGRPQVFPNAYSPVEPGLQTTPAITAFKSALKAQLHTTPTAFDIGIALAYYFTVQLTAKAITKANTTTDTAKIAKAMTQVTLTEFGADFQWDSTHRITVPLAVSQILPDGSTTVGQFKPLP